MKDHVAKRPQCLHDASKIRIGRDTRRIEPPSSAQKINSCINAIAVMHQSHWPSSPKAPMLRANVSTDHGATLSRA